MYISCFFFSVAFFCFFLNYFHLYLHTHSSIFFLFFCMFTVILQQLIIKSHINSITHFQKNDNSFRLACPVQIIHFSSQYFRNFFVKFRKLGKILCPSLVRTLIINNISFIKHLSQYLFSLLSIF